MINNPPKLNDFNSYPILFSNKILNKNFYTELKLNWPLFSQFSTTSAGQVARNNLELKFNNQNYKKIHPSFQKLYDEFNSVDFRNYLKTQFDFDELKNTQGYIGDFDSADLVMHVAESTSGYENPWHVDTRNRIIHFLIYFGDDTIEKGGELAIASHAQLNSNLDYKRYPNLQYIYSVKYINPIDNTGVFILSQNNSYHKGCALTGLRRFIYAGYTNKNGPAWKTGSDWSGISGFSERLKYEKLQI